MAKNLEHRYLFSGVLEIMVLQSLRLRPIRGYTGAQVFRCPGWRGSLRR